ncbi:hypothetical protein [Micromonospora sp. NBRC 107095]|uniref:hypothetical protein n=1 Tax=Micromonospora sp. NBRC 107095 TaxID=3032209 RepID=UPI00332F7DBF
MLTELVLPPGFEADRRPSAALTDLRSGEYWVIVDSPIEAGKSSLVVRAAVEVAAAGQPLMAIARTNEQVDEQLDGRSTTECAHLNVPVQLPAGLEANWSILSSLEGAKTPASGSVRRNALPQLRPVLQEGI